MSTLKVDTILKRTGTGTITVGQSGDTISIPSGATLSVAGSGVTAVDNTPIFVAYHDGDRTVDNGALTKVIAGTEIIDTDSAYDTSTGRFTVPSGKAGYYKITAMMVHRNTSNDQTGSGFAFYKNGSSHPFAFSNSNFTSHRNDTRSYSYIFNLSAGDYIEFYAYTEGTLSGAKIERPTVMGHKLIGA
jgi:hypothetical protein